MIITEKKIGILFLVTGAIAFALMLVGREASKWVELILAVGLIVGGLLQMRLERKK